VGKFGCATNAPKKKHLPDYSSLSFFSFVYALVQDHAPGSLLVEEAGGIVTDARGRPLDFGLGRTLSSNFGVVAAGKEVHAQVIDAIQAVLAEAE
jgi:3'-phosphoadenosine 5'-phosphosulfate (PAPS) 3'-phosphatase